MSLTVNQAPKPVNWSNDPMWMEVETSLIAAGVSSEPNLSLYAKIERNGEFLTELNAPFDLNTALTDFDLSGLDMVKPQPPTDGSMTTFRQGVLTGVSAELHVKIAEMYGDPAVKPTTLTSFGPYVTVYGHTPYWFGNGLTAKSALLHSYYDTTGTEAVKELRKGQPEFVYIYSHDGASVAINIEILYTDGTNTTAAGGSIACTAKKVSWANVGWDAQSCDSIVDTAKVVNSYIVKLTIAGEEQVLIYALDDHETDYDQYLMYDNGIGGCEVLRCSGRHTIGVEGSKSTVAMARIRGRSYQDGFRHTYNAKGAEAWNMQTGYQNQQYIRHLSQLFLAERVWYIDMFREKFVAVTIKESAARLIDFENDLYNMGFTMLYDDRPSISTFNI
jgi:hypothetical protein